MKLKELSELCGVSISTVSRVINKKKGINPETREKILQTIENYEKNINVTKTDKTIALIIPDTENPFFADILKNILNISNSKKIDILLYDSNDNHEKTISILEYIEKKNIDGIILLASSKREKSTLLCKKLESLKTPFILIDKQIENYYFDGVFSDNIKGGEYLTELLLKKDKKNIIVITGSKNSDIAEQRVKGFINSMDFHNIKYDSKNIIYTDFYNKAIIEKELEFLFKNYSFDSIISCNSLITQLCLKYIAKQNLKLEKDISLVCFDEIKYLDNMGIYLDCVSPNLKNLAELSLEMLLKKISKASSYTNIIKIAPNLILKNRKDSAI